MSEAMMWLMGRGVWETLMMTFVSGFFPTCKNESGVHRWKNDHRADLHFGEG